MQYLLNQRYDGTASINFIGTSTLNYNNKVLILESPTDIIGISAITNITHTIKPNSTYVSIKFKYKNYYDWSELLDISELNNITLYDTYKFGIKLYYYFVDAGKLNLPSITISDIAINCLYNIEKTDYIVTLTESSKPIILEPKDTYKVFSITDYQVSIYGLIDDNDVSIQYRITQDNGYHFTQWKPLTTDNLIYTSKYENNDLRFCKFQYLIERSANVKNNINIYDIILIGDFQNVTANSLKTNKYGLREDCITQVSQQNTSAYIDSFLNNNGERNGLSCYSSGDNKNVLSGMTNINSSNNGLWNPYKQIPQVTNFYNFLANQTNNIFGWDVEYFKTSPDNNGIDYNIHEYGLFNVIMKDKIKIIVPENQFPDNTIQFNQFDLDLFNTFEIHILKDVFKNVFGEEERPAKKDIIFFCMTNRLYYVKHAQVFKDIMHSGIYYKVILEKYENKPNIQFLDTEAKTEIQDLTDNTTIDQLFGWKADDDLNKVANKTQMYPKTLEKIRQTINSKVNITKSSVYNGEVDFIQSYYNFNQIINKSAIEYHNVDNILNKFDNRCFISWFNINNYFDENSFVSKKIFDNYKPKSNTVYNLLDNYDTDNNLGYKYYLVDNNLNFNLNGNGYSLPLNDTILTNIWYGVVINLNQRLNNLTLNLYKRNSDVYITYFNPKTYEKNNVISTDTTTINNYIKTGFKPIFNYELSSNVISEFILVSSITYDNIEPVEFDINNTIKLIGSDISYSNLRIFNDNIDDTQINNILNQNIIKDSGKLILADNADRKIYSNNIPTKNFR